MQTANFLGDIFGSQQLMLLTGRIISSALNLALCVGKTALEDTEATISEVCAVSVHVVVPKRIEEVKRLQYAP